MKAEISWSVCMCVPQCYSMTTSHSLTAEHDTSSIAHRDIKLSMLRSRVTHPGQCTESCHFILCEVSTSESSSVMFVYV